MPLPNLTIGTAEVITSLPFEVTLDPEDEPELWYAYDAVADDEPAIGLMPKANGTFFPLLSVWLGPPGSEVEHPAGFGFYSDRRTIMVPVEGGTRYYFKIEPAGASTYNPGETFTLRVYQSPSEAWVIGDIFVPDDTDGFPGIILDPDDGTVKRHVLFPFTERADVLPNGVILAQNEGTTDLTLYSATLEALATLSGFSGGSGVDIRTNGVDKFYASAGSLVRTVDDTGAIGGDSWTITTTSPVAIAPDRTDGILYYAHSGVSQAVRRWDLVNDVAMSDLVAAVTNYFIGEDMFVMADGTILVRYQKTSGGVDHFIRRYNPDGTTAQTYAFGTTVVNRMAWAIEDDSIWVWTQAAGTGTFKRMLLSDGSFPQSFTQYDFVGGVSEEAPTAFPQRFGHSFSCPFFILRAAGGGGGLPIGVIGPHLWIHLTRRIPGSP
jgi:hypothetical protein